MFGVGLPEMLVIVVIAIMIFGPDRIPEFARQAGRMIRQVRDFARATRDDIRSELGPEYASFELTDLDPRRAVRRYIQDAWDETDEDRPNGRPGELGRAARPLAQGEKPPYDADAT